MHIVVAGSRGWRLADLPPSAPSKTRDVVKRLRAALPDLRVVVGRWTSLALADESAEGLP